jgi:hypothetical protein
MIRAIPRLAALAALAGSASLGACGTDASGPSTPGATFTQVMSLSQFDSTLGTGATRLEIKLVAGGLVAREVHVESDDAEEKLTSQVSAIDPSAGTVTLTLGAMVVSYGSGTRFRTPTRSRVSRSEWEAAVASALAAGQQPPIEARRSQPATPQAPTDGSFTASDLRIEDRTDEPAIEAYVDSDNFQSVAAPPPVAILTVYNLPIEITSSTSISLTSPGGTVPSGAVEFQGTVTAADPAAGTITLAGGTVVTVSGVTFDATGDLFSVDAVVSAVAAGKAVRAEGRGTAQSASAVTAESIKVEVD